MPPALIRSRKPWRPSALRALHSLRAPPAPVRESCPLRPPCFGFSLRKPTRNSLILRGAQWHKARPCASERSSDCFGGARFSLPIRAQLGLFFLRASASSRFPIPFHHDAVVAWALRLSQRPCISAGKSASCLIPASPAAGATAETPLAS